jgi:hypothetical protein
MTDCDRCGDDFNVRLCSLGDPGETVARDRIEAALCYGCRTHTPHEVIE